MMYLIGGNDGEKLLNIVELYDYKYAKHYTKQSMKEERDELAVAKGNDGKIYAIGGYGGFPSQNKFCLKSVEVYNPLTDHWDYVASLNIPRRALTAVTLPDGIYAIGGYDGINYLNSVEKFDEMKNKWTLIAPMF
jgi:N-acetylneuraminic acid mutarotase